MLINYESFIPQSSKMIGQTVEEIEKLFNLKINHIHKGGITPKTRIAPEHNKILQAGMTIKICSIDSKTLAKFREYYGLP